MAVYFDTDTNKYYCNFRYRNYLGELKGTTKRGFETYDEAEKWELNVFVNLKVVH